MATALKLRSDIKKLKKALETKGISDSVKSKLKTQLNKAETELDTIQAGKKPKKSSVQGTKTALTALQKLVNRKKYSVYKGAGVDLKKDAGEGAFATGRRVSKGLKSNQWGNASDNKGNVYYEYRPNRLDVKQPRKKQTYPKLEEGGYMAGGGKEYLIFESTDKKKFDDYKKQKKYREQYREDFDDIFNIKEIKVPYDDFISYRLIATKKMASGGYMARGGYMSKGELVWKKLTPSKRMEFLHENFTPEITPRSQELLVGKDFNFLPKNVKIKLEAKYANVEDYASGGYMAKGGAIEHGLKQGDHIFVVNGNILGIKNEETNEFATLDISTGERVEAPHLKESLGLMSYYSRNKEGGYMADGGEIKEMTESETKKLNNKLKEIQEKILDDYGLRRINGSFVNAEVDDYDNDVIDIEVKIGVEGEYSSKEQIQLDRETLEIVSRSEMGEFDSGGVMARGGKLEIGDMVMVDDSGYVKLFSGFDTTKPAKIISKGKTKVSGKVVYFYGLQMEDGRKPFNNAPEYKLTKVSEKGGYMAKGGEIKAGDYVIVDNPHWKASIGVEKAVRRKVKMVADDNVFFHDGSNSSMKYVKKLASGGYMAKGGELNLKVRKMAKEYGLTPDKLGRDYEMTMAQAAVESLTDANYHGAARKLVSILENKPEWAADPYKQGDVPDFNSPDYAKWRDSSVYSSEYWDADDNTSEFARKVATEAGWDGYEIANAYQYLVRMDGGAHKLAEKIKKAMEEDDMQGGAHQPKFQVDDVVFNKKTKTIGIVRMEDDKHGEVKTDADGNVAVDELEYYNPIMHPEHGEGKAAPSTAKEIESRGLWKPFAKRAEKGGYMAEGGIISKTHKLG